MKKSLTLLLLLLATICSSAQVTKVGTYRMSYYGADLAICTEQIGNNTNILIEGYTKEKNVTVYLVLCEKIVSIKKLIGIRDLYVSSKAEAIKQNTQSARRAFPEALWNCGFQWETATDFCFTSEYPDLKAYFVVEEGKCFVEIKATPKDTFCGEQTVLFRFANEGELDTLLEIIKNPIK